MREALEVWDASTDAEKSELSQELIKKKNAYVRHAMSQGPEVRAKDRVYKRLVGMFS
jgi:hypothetical protein